MRKTPYHPKERDLAYYVADQRAVVEISIADAFNIGDRFELSIGSVAGDEAFYYCQAKHKIKNKQQPLKEIG